MTARNAMLSGSERTRIWKFHTNIKLTYVFLLLVMWISYTMLYNKLYALNSLYNSCNNLIELYVARNALIGATKRAVDTTSPTPRRFDHPASHRLLPTLHHLDLSSYETLICAPYSLVYKYTWILLIHFCLLLGVTIRRRPSFCYWRTFFASFHLT